jgi:hypothetical protein
VPDPLRLPPTPLWLTVPDVVRPAALPVAEVPLPVVPIWAPVAASPLTPLLPTELPPVVEPLIPAAPPADPEAEPPEEPPPPPPPPLCAWAMVALRAMTEASNIVLLFMVISFVSMEEQPMTDE